jgi:cGMP-dependent protein kinase
MLKGKRMGELKEGDSFGENALLSDDQVRTMSVVAQGEVRLLSLGRDLLAEMLGADLAKIIFRNKIKLGLKKSTIFNRLNAVAH